MSDAFALENNRGGSIDVNAGFAYSPLVIGVLPDAPSLPTDPSRAILTGRPAADASKLSTAAARVVDLSAALEGMDGGWGVVTTAADTGDDEAVTVDAPRVDPSGYEQLEREALASRFVKRLDKLTG